MSDQHTVPKPLLVRRNTYWWQCPYCADERPEINSQVATDMGEAHIRLFHRLPTGTGANK